MSLSQTDDFAESNAQAARQQWREVADQLRPKVPKLAKLMDEAEPDVLAYMTFPKDHRPKIHSTNPLERVNGEIKRRTEVVGIFPNEDAIIRLVGAILLEQNDEWAVQRARSMTLETIAPLSDDPIVGLPAVAAWPTRLTPATTAISYTTSRDTIEDFAAGVGDRLAASRSRFSQQGFELGEDLLDRIEVRGVFGQKDGAGSGIADRPPLRLSLCEPRLSRVTDVARLQRRREELFDIGVEALAVDRPVEQAGRVDAVVAQGGEESLPLALRDLVDEPLSPWRPAAQAGHVGLRPGFIDEHQAPGVDEPLIGSPSFAVATDVRAILLACDKGLFLTVTPIRRKKRLIIEVSALTPRSAERRSQRA